MVPVGNAAHLDRYGSNDTVALEPEHGSRYRARSQTFTLSSIVTGAFDRTSAQVPSAAGTWMQTWPPQQLRSKQSPGSRWQPMLFSLYEPSSSITLGHQERPDSGYQCDLWWQHGSETSAQIQAVDELQTQIWSLTTAQTACHHGPSWHHRLPISEWTSDANLTQILGTHSAINGYRSHGNRHTLWLR